MNSRKAALASKLSTPIIFCDRHCDGPSQIDNYRLDDLPYDLYVQLIRCNMGSHGCMQDLFKTMFNEWNEDAWASVCTDQSGYVLGWGLVYTMPLRGATVCDFHVYVRKPFRRRYVGSDVCRQCNEIATEYFDTQLHITPHDKRSKAFFIHNNIPIFRWRK